jgi:hypothetical protein
MSVEEEGSDEPEAGSGVGVELGVSVLTIVKIFF